MASEGFHEAGDCAGDQLSTRPAFTPATTARKLPGRTTWVEGQGLRQNVSRLGSQSEIAGR